MIKLTIVGDSSVGKSAFVTQLIDGIFSSCYDDTPQVNYFSKDIIINKNKHNVKIWDTSGNKKCNGMVKSYLRKIHGVIIVYDITNRTSFVNLRKWINLIHSVSDIRDTKIMILGTKNDLVDARRVSYNEAYTFFPKK